MTKEIVEIVAAFKEAQQHGRKTALATVVHVEGSSYRRPGARMLVDDSGKMTGAISGGCLEGDALRKALLSINQRENKLVIYNTLDEDDVEVGVQLGCNGIVSILFEPIDPAQTHNPIALLENTLLNRKDAVLVTIFSLTNYNGIQHGTCLFFDGKAAQGTIEDEQLATKILPDAAKVFEEKSSQLKQYNNNELTAFVELLQPPISLVVVGAGNDALPLVEMALVLGWHVTVADGRKTHASHQRFSKAHNVIAGKPREIIKQLTLDERSFIVLMTHNYNYDLEMVGLLLQQKCRYIGTLGPKMRLDRILNEIGQRGQAVTAEHRAMIYGPTGLDIGAETSEEIALSVLAEIKAVLAQRHGTSLRDRTDLIHSRSTLNINQTKIESLQ